MTADLLTHGLAALAGGAVVLLALIWRPQPRCEYRGCAGDAIWHDPASDLRTCDEHLPETAVRP